MRSSGPNHPFVVWASVFLWLTSIFSITWSLLLFLCVGDILTLTGTDLVNAVVLLSGLIMLPTNVYMLHSIGSDKTIDHKAKVVCCPLWLCVLWIIIICLIGVVLCGLRIRQCQHTTNNDISLGMRNYRNYPKYKHFIDNIQWSLGCCGLNSYKDWFTQDWYDKVRDYEWNRKINKRNKNQNISEHSVSDSVPLSCCKDGSCISNYLLELGTYYINTNGCGNLMHRIIMTSMFAHIMVFIFIISMELISLKYVMQNNTENYAKSRRNAIHVRHIMPVKNNFEVSSDSYQFDPDDSEDIGE